LSVCVLTVCDILGIRVFWAVAGHVALGSAPEALSFGSILCSFLVREFLKWCSYIGGIHIHRYMFVVAIGALTGILVHVAVT
jgi:hypothetical protein